MNTFPIADERVKHLRVTGNSLSVDLMDGRTIRVPLAWFPRLVRATARQRANWRPAASGYGVHWPDLDEDLSVAGLLRVSAFQQTEPAMAAGARPVVRRRSAKKSR